MSFIIDLKIFLFAFLFFFTHQIKMYAILMMFALIHELGHLVCGLILGFKPKTLKANAFGFQIAFEIKIEEYHQKIKKGYALNLKRLAIALAGPVTNFLLAMLFYIVPIQNEGAKQTLIYSNLLIGIFNLLPIYPLDGGRVLKELFHMLYGLSKTYKIIYQIGFITVLILTFISSIVILYLKNIAIVVILGYLWYLVIQNYKWYQLKSKVFLAF